MLDCSSIDFIDTQGSQALGELAEVAHATHSSFRLARVGPSIIELLDRDGVLEAIGRDHIHVSVDHAVEAELASANGALVPTGEERK